MCVGITIPEGRARPFPGLILATLCSACDVLDSGHVTVFLVSCYNIIPFMKRDNMRERERDSEILFIDILLLV